MCADTSRSPRQWQGGSAHPKKRLCLQGWLFQGGTEIWSLNVGPCWIQKVSYHKYQEFSVQNNGALNVTISKQEWDLGTRCSMKSRPFNVTARSYCPEKEWCSQCQESSPAGAEPLGWTSDPQGPWESTLGTVSSPGCIGLSVGPSRRLEVLDLF